LTHNAHIRQLDKYDTQSAIALLRQHLDYAGWYDSSKLTLKTVVDCQYVACMNPTAGSFLVNPRLQRHFSIFAVGLPSATSLLTIFQTFLDGHLKHGGFEASVCNITSNLIKGALSVQKEIHSTFRKTAANFHYESVVVSVFHSHRICIIMPLGSMCATRCLVQWALCANGMFV
jgi:dynein heavy chain